MHSLLPGKTALMTMVMMKHDQLVLQASEAPSSDPQDELPCPLQRLPCAKSTKTTCRRF